MPGFSMLKVLLIMYSVPVLISLVLFFPEVKQLFSRCRTHSNAQARPTIVKWPRERGHGSNVLLFECLLPMVAAATVGLIYGLLAGISWTLCLLLMGALAALIGGTTFTLIQMSSVKR